MTEVSVEKKMLVRTFTHISKTIVIMKLYLKMYSSPTWVKEAQNCSSILPYKAKRQ